MTRYAEAAGQNTWTGGARISPLSLEAAKKWAEENMDADDYMQEFGPVEEDDSRVMIHASLPADVAARLRRVRRAGDGRIYSALAAARKPAAAANLAGLGKRIMAARNVNYIK